MMDRTRCCFFSAPMLLSIIFILLGMAGCSGVAVYSIPSGADILVDGKSTGQKTPHRILIRDLSVGRHRIEVGMSQHKMVTPPQDVDVGISYGQIFWSWIPPVLIENLADDLWKGVTYPKRPIKTFVLRNVTDPSMDPL